MTVLLKCKYKYIINMNSSSDEFKRLILSSKEPLLFRNVLKSQLLSYNLEDWKNILKDRELQFRCGEFKQTNQPQWERTCKMTKGTFAYFLDQAGSESNWLYFDYKYLGEWLTDVESLRKNISWASLGFSDITADDTTIWIGSKGAHTPCHVDTYGFNLIFQVFGKKLWIISPPEENLKPTRIPYEESSIYSKLNFFSPSTEEFKGLNNFRKIILSPGDVLFLPHKWWHYVENLETAISINAWMPSPEDDDERLKESIVQMLVKQITETSGDETRKHILNPNMENVR
ncbi:hypothetical protein NQ318_018907 [Aromia moschata]|uniref:JmjC domain-containing protein n=1 Tax=Aromia moschata TaxID=1265417 RepID=A0AAV8ZIW9_9CUCU|nr:hypothetical protein NQ318_018907 [Aromia moschata]